MFSYNKFKLSICATCILRIVKLNKTWQYWHSTGSHCRPIFPLKSSIFILEKNSNFDHFACDMIGYSHLKGKEKKDVVEFLLDTIFTWSAFLGRVWRSRSNSRIQLFNFWPWKGRCTEADHSCAHQRDRPDPHGRPLFGRQLGYSGEHHPAEESRNQPQFHVHTPLPGNHIPNIQLFIPLTP